tara:strand:- start:1903 stop:2028 length:126 start_codon:yes stop_codon:yes gene_type:complete
MLVLRAYQKSVSPFLSCGLAKIEAQQIFFQRLTMLQTLKLS